MYSYFDVLNDAHALLKIRVVPQVVFKGMILISCANIDLT